MTFVPPERRNEDTLKWVCVDFDGTLCNTIYPDFEMGEPISGAREKMIELVHHGYKPIIFTSRHWSDYETIEAWLQHYDIPYSRITCGKPLAKLYIDDKALHNSADSWIPQH